MEKSDPKSKGSNQKKKNNILFTLKRLMRNKSNVNNVFG